MRIQEWIFLFIVASCGIALANFVGFQVGLIESLPGIGILFVLSLCGVVISKVLPIRLPIVAYCSLLGLLAASPFLSVGNLSLHPLIRSTLRHL